MKLVCFAILCATLCACGGSKIRSLSNAELATKRDQCIRKNPSAPGQVTACENIRKECERRRTEGNYAC